MALSKADSDHIHAWMESFMEDQSDVSWASSMAVIVDLASVACVDENGNGSVSVIIWGKPAVPSGEPEKSPEPIGIVSFRDPSDAQDFRSTLARSIGDAAKLVWKSSPKGKVH